MALQPGARSGVMGRRGLGGFGRPGDIGIFPGSLDPRELGFNVGQRFAQWATGRPAQNFREILEAQEAMQDEQQRRREGFELLRTATAAGADPETLKEIIATSPDLFPGIAGVPFKTKPPGLDEIRDEALLAALRGGPLPDTMSPEARALAEAFGKLDRGELAASVAGIKRRQPRELGPMDELTARTVESLRAAGLSDAEIYARLQIARGLGSPAGMFGAGMVDPEQIQRLFAPAAAPGALPGAGGVGGAGEAQFRAALSSLEGFVEEGSEMSPAEAGKALKTVRELGPGVIGPEKTSELVARILARMGIQPAGKTEVAP